MKDDTDFTGRRVLVVGGSSGIGNGVAHGFRDRGAEVHVWGTRAAATDYDPADGSDLGGLGYTCVDVGDPDAIQVAALPFDGLDVLILCQGTVVYRRGEFEREGWDRVMAVNLDSLMHISRKFRAQLADAGGSIVIVSSISGLKANIGNPAYAASKAGAISLTKTLGQLGALRRDLGQFRIDQPRRQPVDADAVGGERLPQRLGQADRPGFRRGIGGDRRSPPTASASTGSPPASSIPS